MRALIVALAVSGCTSSLASRYCEAGGQGGGDCLSIEQAKLDSDPTTIGSARLAIAYSTPGYETLQSRYKDRFSVRRVDKTHYNLFLKGALAGSFEHHDNWIHVQLGDTKWRMRSDQPGFFH
jgi:hypothetical protein